MKYILILLISIVFAQVPSITHAFGQETQEEIPVWTCSTMTNLLSLIEVDTTLKPHEYYIDEEIDTTLTSEYELIPIKGKPLLDFTLETPADRCFQIYIDFQGGWFENWLNMRDSILAICPNMIDVRIEYEGIIQDYTMEEFLERLGFIEWLKQ
ncbi:hypothetical protein LCGC14_2116290 [marine sediment metagenome]|uniref:Uncharacterized protein n=1 Tax=marine sediment metagenome TaxID=412755 RepID=A0A0F9E5N5_9ZZZZ